jgi:spore germination protein KC
MLDSTLGRILAFNHIEFIIFSEDLAKQGISNYVAALYRYRELRLTTSIFICKGKASELMKESKPLVGTGVSKTFHLISEKGTYTGFFPDIDFRSFYGCIKSTYSQPAAPLAAVNGGKNFIKEGQPGGGESVTGGQYVAGELPREGDNKIDIFGTAVFKGEKMVGELTGDETRFFQMLGGQFEQGRFTMQDPEAPDKVVVFDVSRAQEPETEIKFEGEDPVINVKVYLDGDIYSIQSMVNYENLDKQPELEEAFKNILKDGMEKIIGKCRELGVDIFGFGKTAARSFLTIEQLESYNWNSHFSKAKVTVEVVFNIRRTGTLLKSNEVKGG